MAYMKELVRGIQKMVQQKIATATANMLVKVQVKEVYEKEEKLYIRVNTLHNQVEYADVKLLSHGIGHGRGILAYPKAKDFGVVINILGERYYIGSTHDDYTTNPDRQLLLAKDNVLLVNNPFGSYISMSKNNDIILKTKNGAKIKLAEDGSFKLFNKNNYGLEMDSSGNLTTRAASTSSTTSPGTWENLS